MTHESERPRNTFCGRTRREFLWEAGGAFTSVALAGMLSTDDFLGAQTVAADGVSAWKNPLAAKPPHFDGPAKSVIFLFMYGGPSQVDTFDYKPDLYPLDGKTIEVNTKGRGGTRNQGRVVGPKWQFKQYGECGKWVSDLFPHLGGCVDDIAFIHSMTADAPLHGSAMLQMNSGRILSGSPALGSWVNYGLGTENENLPGFVVMLDPTGGPISGAKNWSSGYMPASYQGDRDPVERHADPLPRPAAGHVPPGAAPAARPSAGVQRGARRTALREQRARRPHRQLRARLPDAAARARSCRPLRRGRGDASSSTAWTRTGRPRTSAVAACSRGGWSSAASASFRSTRAAATTTTTGTPTATWSRTTSTTPASTDKPIAGLLLKDLKRRGLLDEHAGHLGRRVRSPAHRRVRRLGTGRDHNAYGFTMWMAGGGIKGGTSVGETDELGNRAEVDRFHVKNLHATVLQQLGLDPNALSYFHAGLDQKLVGVEGAEPIHQIVA